MKTYMANPWGGGQMMEATSPDHEKVYVKYETAKALKKAIEDLLEGFDEELSESTDSLNKRIWAAEALLKSLEDGKD